MTFREWLETVNYGNNWIIHNFLDDKDLIRFVKAKPENKEILLNDIMSQLKQEGWAGFNYTFVVNKIRHLFTNYDKQMNQLRNKQDCERLQELTNITNQAFLLVKAVINYILPDNMRQSASTANLKWLENKILITRAEESKLAQPCTRLVLPAK